MSYSTLTCSTERWTFSPNQFIIASYSQGQRLTYTHFTAKVNWNSMIEITFNRSVRISRNKVYRIGMVLNKVS